MSEEKQVEVNTEPKPKADISFEVGYKDEKTRFDLRMISTATENEINEEFTSSSDLQGEEKAQKEYEVCRDVLIRLSDSSEKDTLRIKFKDFNIKNERIIRRAFLAFKSELEPDVIFLPRSA